MKNDLDRLDRKTVITDEFPFKYCVYYLDEKILMGDTLEKATQEIFDLFEGQYKKSEIKKKFRSCTYGVNATEKFYQQNKHSFI